MSVAKEPIFGGGPFAHDVKQLEKKCKGHGNEEHDGENER